MKRGRTAALTLFLALLFAPAVLASSADDIYRDYADNGKLDKQYSDRELQAFLQNPSVQGYGRVTVAPKLRNEVLTQIAPKRQTLPFTGLDLALLTAGGLALLLAGGGFRWLARRRS
jgi:pantothenate kinase-related protein Tda10